MTYVDGFVASVPTAKRAAFLEHSQAMGKLFKEYGATSVIDCWGDDVPEGKLTSFPMAVQCKPDETVVFSWITWPSREVRDASWEKVMADPRMQSAPEPPFDGKRMIFGGFRNGLCRIATAMGLLTFSINLTLDGCIDHQEGIADDETHAFFTRLMDENGAMLWGRVTYEMMESYWPAVARGEVEAPPAMREWAAKLEAKPKYVVSSTRTEFPWTNSHHIAGDLRAGVQKLKDATPGGVLLGSGKLAAELDRLDLIDEYQLLVHPRIAGHGPTLYEGGLPSTRRLELVSVKPFGCGAVAMHYRRAR